MANKLIYCLDDVSSMRFLYQNMFNLNGFSVQTYERPDTFMAACRECAPDAAIVDVHLTHGTGLEAVHEFRSWPATQFVPLVVASGDRSRRTISTLLQAGADEYMTKPLDLEEMIRRVIGLLERERQVEWMGQSLAPGTVLNERYELQTLLARGAQNILYRALDLQRKTVVVVKMLGGTQEDVTSARYMKQAIRQIVHHSQLDHPNIVRCSDYGQHQITFYTVMELLDGHALECIVEAGGPGSGSFVLQVGLVMTDVLQNLAERSICHQQLVPGNIQLTRRGEVKLVGFSQVTHASAATMQQDLVDLSRVLWYAMSRHLPKPGEAPRAGQKMTGDYSRSMVNLLERMLSDRPLTDLNAFRTALESSREPVGAH